MGGKVIETAKIVGAMTRAKESIQIVEATLSEPTTTGTKRIVQGNLDNAIDYLRMAKRALA